MLSLLRTPLYPLTALLFVASIACARDISEMSLTECGIECYETTCNSTTNLGCVCTTAGFNAVGTCLATACDSASTYYTSYRVLYRDCDVPRPVWTEDPNYFAAAIIVYIIQTAAFGLRVATRVMGLGKWGWDDITCVIAYATLVGQLVMCILEGYYGDYVNYWTLDFDRLPYFWRVDFARAIIYAIGLGLSKMSILFLYQRIFEGARLRRVLLASHIFNALLILSYLISAFFVAQPLNCNWELNQPLDCTYNDVWDGSGAYPALNAAFDIWLVLIPAVIVSRLQMKTERKVNVIAVFATGILTSLVAVLRFAIYRVQGLVSELSDATYQHVIIANYYAYYAELTCCFVIACLPAIRQLVGKKIWPLFKTQVLSRLPSSSILWCWSWSRSFRNRGKPERAIGSDEQGTGSDGGEKGIMKLNGRGKKGRFSLTLPSTMASSGVFSGTTTATTATARGTIVESESYVYNNFDDYKNSRIYNKNNAGADKGTVMTPSETIVELPAILSPKPHELNCSQHSTSGQQYEASWETRASSTRTIRVRAP